MKKQKNNNKTNKNKRILNVFVENRCWLYFFVFVFFFKKLFQQMSLIKKS